MKKTTKPDLNKFLEQEALYSEANRDLPAKKGTRVNRLNSHNKYAVVDSSESEALNKLRSTTHA